MLRLVRCADPTEIEQEMNTTELFVVVPLW